MFPKFFFILVLSSLLLAACAQSPADALALGKAQYVSQCASCHSVDASGSDRAPAALGFSAGDIMAQVRDPEGEMPAFPAELLSDEDLALIVQYMLSLSPEGETAHEEIEPSAAEKVHLLAAFEAIEDYRSMDRELAISHLQEAIALASVEAAEEYEELIEAIENGKAGIARHELEEMLGMMEH